MARLFLRLDDACEKMDLKKWALIEGLLDKYNVKPLVGVIPQCEDKMMNQYPVNKLFWELVKSWINKGWTIAMHGFNHVYSTNCGGINPVNKRSEFAGEPLVVQEEKIKNAIKIFKSHSIDPDVFFAPSHTFDDNTLIALKEHTNISIISDTIAWDCYFRNGFIFVPQQSGRVRKLPFKTITFCYHPNTMSPKDFEELERFLQKHKFSPFLFSGVKRKYKPIDRFLRFLYFKIRK